MHMYSKNGTSLDSFKERLANLISNQKLFSELKKHQLETLVELDKEIFGDLPGAFDLSELSKIPKEIGPTCWMLSNNGSFTGYISLFPLSNAQKRDILLGCAKGVGDFDFSDLDSPTSKVTGVFVEAVACKISESGFGRAALARLSRAVIQEFNELVFYAVPITEIGLKFQKRLGFKPLRAPGLYNPYFRQSFEI